MSVASELEEDVWHGIQAFAEQYPGLSEQDIAERFVDAMSGAQRKRVLVHAVMEVVGIHRRAAERAAARDVESRAVVLDVHLSRWPVGSVAWTEEQGEIALVEAARVAKIEQRDARERDERQRLLEADPDAYYARYEPMESLRRLLDKFRNEMRLELTAELLGSSFAVGDGRTVTWASATIGDHRIRVDTLGRHVAGSLQTLALHTKAIQMIESAGVQTLGEVAG